MARRWRIPGWVTALAAILVLAALLWFGDVGAVLRDLGRVSPDALAAALCVVTLGYGLRFAKWHLLANSIDLRLRPARSVQVFLGGLMMVVTPAKLGDLWKSVLLTQDSIPVARSLPAVGLERVLDFAAVCVLAGIGLALIMGQPWLLAVVFLGFGAIFILLRWKAAWLWTERWLGRHPKLKPAAGFVDTLFEGTQRLLHPRILVPAFLLAVVAWTLEGVALGFLVRGLGIQVATTTAVAAFCLGTIAGVASFLPGGLGPTEAGMVALLVTNGVPSPVAVAATLLARACTLGYGSLVGAVATLLWRKPVTGAADIAPAAPAASVESAAQDGRVMDAQGTSHALEAPLDGPQDPQ